MAKKKAKNRSAKKPSWKDYKDHPLADPVPQMSSGSRGFKALVQDIKRAGKLAEPITLYDGMILDGRNRYRACVRAGVEPTFRTFRGSKSKAADYVVSKNLQRRHLTTPQRAVLAVELILPEEIKNAQQRKRAKSKEKPNLAGSGRATDAAGKRAAVSAENVRLANRIKMADRPAFRAMRDGIIRTMPEAIRLMKVSKGQRRSVIATVRKTGCKVGQAVTNVADSKSTEKPVPRPWDRAEPQMGMETDAGIQARKRLDELDAELTDLDIGDRILAVQYGIDLLQRHRLSLPAETPRIRAGRGGVQVPHIYQYVGGKTEVLGTLTRALGRLAGDAAQGDYELREPFTGSGSVSAAMLWMRRARRVRLNDYDTDMARLWNQIIRNPGALKARVRKLKLDEVELLNTHRRLEGSRRKGADAALDQLVSLVCGFRGATMAVSGVFYLGLEHWDADRVCESIDAVHALFEGKVASGRCTHQDAVEIIREPGPAVIYCDPPYIEEEKSSYRFGFPQEKHRELAEALSECEMPWLVTYGFNAWIRGLYKGHVMREIVVERPVTSTKAVELWICNRRHPHMLEGLRQEDVAEPNYIQELFGEEEGD